MINHGNAGNQTKDTESTTQMAEMPGRSPANSATTPEISTKITQISGVPSAFSGRNDRGFRRALRTFGPRGLYFRSPSRRFRLPWSHFPAGDIVIGRNRRMLVLALFDDALGLFSPDDTSEIADLLSLA